MRSQYPRRLETAAWREGMRQLRELVGEAENARGKVRRELLVRAARIVVDLEASEPVTPRKWKGRERAIVAMERAVGDLARDCVGCLAMERLDGEPSRKAARSRAKHDRDIAEGRADYAAGRVTEVLVE